MEKQTNLVSSLCIPAESHFTQALAKHILHRHAEQLPNISNVHIILPNAQAAFQLRYQLSQQANTPLLGGFIGSLPRWLSQHIEHPDTIKQQMNQSTRQLLLIEALKQFPDLFEPQHHWQVCDSLLELFDELNLSEHGWLNQDKPSWLAQFQSAYQAHDTLKQLNQEATIIHTIWCAWQEQLQALSISDESALLKQQLMSVVPEAFNQTIFYLVGAEQLPPLAKAWCAQREKSSQVFYVTQDNIPGQEPEVSTGLLETIYSQDEIFYQRVKKASNQSKSFLENIKTYDTQSAEQEARAVDIKVRSSLLSGHNNIAVVTENRKLARRLRALLERANVNIQDTAGWSLATTSAATVLERWLECIEQDFAYQPLLDLLKSPFFCTSDSQQAHLSLIYRFEQDIVLHENIANDIQRYQNAIKYRSERLNIDISSSTEQLTQLLQRIKEASEGLLTLFQTNAPTKTSTWISCFQNSLVTLGVYEQLQHDMAGIRIQQELEKLQHAENISDPELNWQDFRNWLGSILEREQFKPHSKEAAVKIMNMQQAQYCQFDTLIIAAANAESLPGSASKLPFFNQSVRQSLQLKNWHEQSEYLFYQFKQLLFSANDILITWQSEKNGEWIQASPWVNSLINFSEHAFKQSLRDEELHQLIIQNESITQTDYTNSHPAKIVAQAKPVITPERLPKEFSAARHQRLIDCPYKFFAADILKLKPLEQVTLELLKSEYGEKMHLILYAFHMPHKNLPKPFSLALNPQNKAQAMQHMEQLSHKVFSSNAEDSIQHRAWLNRWMETAEAYIDWQIERVKDWKIDRLEHLENHVLNESINLAGRLDRIDKNNDGLSIIDYKTGASDSQSDIENAEKIQLISYAALLHNVENVIYLKLDKGEVKAAATLEDENLQQLKDDITLRLQTTLEQIKQQTPLVSWGDEKTCGYCDMSGLCRKQYWEIND